MVSKVLGKVSISPKGSFAADTQYSALDEVSHLGGSWLCLKSALGIEPGVTSGWEAYWMSVAIGIKDVVISSPAEGQTQITIVCSNGREYSSTFNNLDIPDGSITTEKLAAGAVNTDSIKDKAVTPAKLDRAYAELDANDKVTPDQASSLVVMKTESYTLQASDAGKFIMFSGSGAKTLTVPDDPSDELFPIGTEIEVCHYAYDVTSVTIAESSNVRIYSPGQKKTLVSQSACVVLKKVRPNEWILAGALR